MKKAIIVDVDGTLAEKGDRHPFDFASVSQDKPREAITELVQFLAKRYVVIIFSGREDSCREDTDDWLVSNGVIFDELYMRKTGDHRKDSIVKREMFEMFVKGRYNIRFVLDDRDQVVKMWREELGLDCLQVAPGDF